MSQHRRRDVDRPDPLQLPQTAGDAYEVGYVDGIMSRPAWRRVVLAAAIIAAMAFTLGYAAGRADAAPSSPPGAVRVQQGQSGAPTDEAIPRTRGIEPATTTDPAPEAVVGAPPSPAAVSQQPSASAVSVRGTWYCNADPARGPLSRCTRGHPDGPGLDLYAAVSPDLAELRGQQIRVCLAARCVVVRAIDCVCSAQAAVDLYADAFAVLAPLSVGRLDGLTVEVVP